MRAKRRGLISGVRSSFAALFGAIWFVVGLPFLVAGLSIGISQSIDAKRLASEGRSVQGMVLVKALTGDNGQHEVTYRFSPENGGLAVKATATVDHDTWNRLVERGPVQVTYVPANPRTNRVERQQVSMILPLVFGIIGGILSLIGGGLLIYGLRRK